MAIYLDANVIAALLLSEPTSPHVADILRREEEFVIGDFTSAEVAAVISRRVRMAVDSNAQATSRLEGLDRLKAWAGAAEPLESEDIRLAERLIRIFDLKLRAPDAIHAALCLRHRYALATFDRGLAHAARALGVTCINPAETIGEQKN